MRFRSFFLSLISGLLCYCTAAAQTGDSSLLAPAPGLRISLLTCGPGAEIYSVFGHTAVRITDSSSGRDIVYNYGTFDGYDADFESKFMRGKLLYYLSVESFEDFMALYRQDGRKVEEQELRLSREEQLDIQDYLSRNMQPENRAYKYDFFFDNCATRIRDLFPRSVGDGFRYPELPEAKQHISFRRMINRYLRPVPWERLGINILLGSKTDQVMDTRDLMFLPDYLRDGLAGATVHDQPFANPAVLLHESLPTTAGPNQPLILLWLIAALTIAGLSIPRLRLLGQVMSTLLLLVTGLLGALILFMWFGTDHQACGPNYNLLWALPSNLLFLFRPKAYKYALLAIVLLLASLLLHILGIQQLLLAEMTPLLLAQLFVFSSLYKRYQTSSVSHA